MCVAGKQESFLGTALTWTVSESRCQVIAPQMLMSSAPATETREEPSIHPLPHTGAATMSWPISDLGHPYPQL